MTPQSDSLIQRIPLTSDLSAQLTSINQLVNSEVTYVSDLTKYGVEEKWENAELEGNEGDCEDYVIAKRLRLRNLGWPLATLDFVMCYDETNSYHCILVARCTDPNTSQPLDQLLDSRQYSVWDWNNPAAPMSQYKLVETTVGGTFKNWRDL